MLTARQKSASRVARLVGPAAGEPVGEHDRIDRACRGAGNALDLEPAIVEQLVEHAPGEGAVRAAALQRQIDPLAPPAWSRGQAAGLRRRVAARPVSSS